MIKKPENIEQLQLFWDELSMDFMSLPQDPIDDFSPFYAAGQKSLKHLFFAMMISDIILEICDDHTNKSYDCFSREVDLCFTENEEEEYYKEKRKLLQKKIKKNLYFKKYSIGFNEFPAFFYEMDNINDFYIIFEIQNMEKIKEFGFSSNKKYEEDFREFFKEEIAVLYKLFRDLNQYLALNILEKTKDRRNLNNDILERKFDRNQVVLLMDRLKMIQAIEEKPITVQAKIISELTGFNYDNIRKSISSLSKKQSKLTPKQKLDKNKVDIFVESLG